MCDGQAASNCDIISLAEYESMVNNRTVEVDDQFSAMSEAINKALEVKKEALMKIYRTDPRISRDDAVLTLNKMIEDFNAVCLNNQTEHCKTFSDRNKNVIVSSCRRSVHFVGRGPGYCFLNHQRTRNDTLLKWTLRVPRFNYFIGIVTNVI